MKKIRCYKALNLAIVLVLLTTLGGTWLHGQKSPVYAATDVTYFYFNSKSTSNWANSAYMIDQVLTNYAYTSTGGTTETLNGTDCLGTNLGTIIKVELGVYAYGDGNDYIDLTPYFGGTSGGSTYRTTPGTGPSGAWHYVDITDDTAGPSPGNWTWNDIQNIDVDVTYTKAKSANQMNCGAVVIGVTYTVTTPGTYTITATAGAGGTISPSGDVSVNPNDSQTFAILPEANHHIDNVVVDDSSVGPVDTYTFTSVTDNHTIDAYFAIDTYTITATAEAFGTISPSGAVSVNATDSKIFTITPDSHYHIDDVVVDDYSVGALSEYTFTSVTDNHTIDAYFAIDTHDLRIEVSDGGTTNPEAGYDHAYPYGKVVSIYAIPDVGWKFVNWTGDVDTVAEPNLANTTITMYKDNNITANFAINTYTITATAGAGGTISPSGDVSVNPNDSQTFAILPEANHHIDHVVVDDSSVGPVDTYTFTSVTDNHTIDAYFAIDTYTITATAEAFGTISPSGDVSVNATDSKTFTITPDSHYHIDDVVVDVVSVGPVDTYTFHNVTDNHTIDAYFAIDTHDLHITVVGSGTTIPEAGYDHAYPYGTVASISAIPDAGWKFVNWTGDVDTVAEPNLADTTITMYGDKNITANFAEITYYLMTMSANPKSITADGTSNSTITVTVNYQDGSPVPEGTGVELTTDKGSLSSLTTNTTNGVATANLTSSTIVETATVTATVGDGSAATAVFFTRAGVTVGDFQEEKTDPYDDTVDFMAEADTEVEKSGMGTPTITIARYSGNPEGTTPGGFQAVGDYIDVHADNVTAVSEIVVKHYYTTADITGLNEASLTIHWWNGTAWVQCSESGVAYPAGAPDYRGYVWAKIGADTTPNLTDLTGTAFTAMATPSPPRPRRSGGGGDAPIKGVLKLDFMGTIYAGEIDVQQGLLVEPLEVPSLDGLFTFKIGLDSKVLTTEGKVPDRIEIRNVSQPPSPPADSKIVSDVYEIIPSGITFQPAATLVLGFDPAGLPEHTSSLTMVYYTPEGGWVELESERGVAAELETMTAEIAHLTLFAILAKLQAVFEVSDLAIKPTGVAEGESVTITVKVTNSGGATGEYALKLEIDNIVEAVREITLDPGVSQIISFTVEGAKPGEHKVGVDDLNGSFTVVSPPPPPLPPTPTPPVTPTPSNLPVISGILIAIVAVIAGLGYFLLYKRQVIGRGISAVPAAIVVWARFLVSRWKSKT